MTRAQLSAMYLLSPFSDHTTLCAPIVSSASHSHLPPYTAPVSHLAKHRSYRPTHLTTNIRFLSNIREKTPDGRHTRIPTTPRPFALHVLPPVLRLDERPAGCEREGEITAVIETTVRNPRRKGRVSALCSVPFESNVEKRVPVRRRQTNEKKGSGRRT